MHVHFLFLKYNTNDSFISLAWTQFTLDYYFSAQPFKIKHTITVNHSLPVLHQLHLVEEDCSHSVLFHYPGGNTYRTYIFCLLRYEQFQCYRSNLISG